ncbi:MAG: apolipoprotein N-acyltransferase [Nitrospirales bacterium]|nr:MAG: apolipoprotein N-acyltransferase [Nitrospirales bacterium]
MRVGFYQYAPEFGEVTQNVDAVIDRLESIDCDLLVLPELAMSGYQFCSGEEVERLAESVPDGLTTRRLAELAKRRQCYIAAGLPERHAGKFYNSAVLVGPSGFIGVYRKVHLFFEETLFFSPGDLGFQVWNIGPVHLGLLICFDWFYPEAARTLALKGADILCHPSNLVLPHCPDAMVTRCLENRVFCITANRIGEETRGGKPSLRFIGKSEIISPSGKILHRAPEDESDLVLMDIDPMQARDKNLNPYNDLLRDRRPHYYE